MHRARYVEVEEIGWAEREGVRHVGVKHGDETIWIPETVFRDWYVPVASTTADIGGSVG